ncbi:hypothetical protein K1719_035858 [Acacia pycnantha]|nr:hypothetical protein K1719_035858 [Acacia pycnantha]
MIKKGWGLDKGMEIHELPDYNAFLFRFQKLDEYYRVLKGRPWSIQGWDEKAGLKPKSQMAAEQPGRGRLTEDPPKYGNREVKCTNPASSSMIPKYPAKPDPSSTRQPSTLYPTPNKDYQVYFPVTEIDAPTTSLPITGLSPLSAVTFGLNRIHLKHRPDLLEDDLTLNPTKKRLTFPEPEATTILTNSPILARMELQARMSILLKNPFGGIKVNSQTRLLSYFQLLLRLTRYLLPLLMLNPPLNSYSP